MKTIALCVATAFLTLSAMPAFAGDPVPAAAGAAMTTSQTDLGTLLDNPAAKAVLQKYISQLISNPQIEMARSMTLKQLQGFAGDALSDATLANIDADLSKIPVK